MGAFDYICCSRLAIEALESVLSTLPTVSEGASVASEHSYAVSGQKMIVNNLV